ncbi:MAG: glycosyltransferase [Proteobacteria bacterium]|nr:glycosyltransferase [Pseudomonadota bacterium]
MSPENSKWLADFKHKHGRSPRVLHIGNIANNAYNNAKLLISAGIDCDVICYDYYHIMGCYEWEDVEFSGPILDPFKPNWIAAGIKTCNRPRWFAQGPIKRCIDYLVAKRKRDQGAAEILWKKLVSRSGYSPFDKGPPLVQKSIDFFTKSRKMTRHILHKAKNKYKSMIAIIDGELINTNYFDKLMQNISTKGKSIKQHISHDKGYNKKLAIPRLIEILLTILKYVTSAAFLLIKVFLKSLHLIIRLPSVVLSRKNITIDSEFNNRVNYLIEKYRQEFPDREDALSYGDLISYQNIIPLWKQLFENYDFIIAYSTDPIIPMIADKSYFALEHGTIREIPYQDTSVGRATSLAYRMAQHVFVTNTDCVASAEKLAPGRYTLINHPYDEDHGLAVSGWEKDRLRLCQELRCEMLFFFPTRQDWVPGTGYADKANDVFIRAVGTLRKQSLSLGLVCCQWGKNVKQTKALINELGFSQNVKWVEPMAMVAFERMARAAHCVVDQFLLGAFGGVLFKAMAVGAPIMTYLDERVVLRQYPQCPPVINCRTEGDIVQAIAELYRCPEKLKQAGSDARTWMKKYHSKNLAVNTQVDQFRASSLGGPNLGCS